MLAENIGPPAMCCCCVLLPACNASHLVGLYNPGQDGKEVVWLGLSCGAARGQGVKWGSVMGWGQGSEVGYHVQHGIRYCLGYESVG